MFLQPGMSNMNMMQPALTAAMQQGMTAVMQAAMPAMLQSIPAAMQQNSPQATQSGFQGAQSGMMPYCIVAQPIIMPMCMMPTSSFGDASQSGGFPFVKVEEVIEIDDDDEDTKPNAAILEANVASHEPDSTELQDNAEDYWVQDEDEYPTVRRQQLVNSSCMFTT